MTLRSLLPAVAACAALLSGVACSPGAPSGARTPTPAASSPASKPGAAPAAVAAPATAKAAAAKAAASHAPGVVPFEYPIAAAPAAAAGDFVLTPSRAFIDRAFTRGGEKSTFIFYGSRMVLPGAAQSRVRQVSTEVDIPNSLIIPIRRGEQAKPGDVVLTHWQSGSGMQRAIVVPGGTPTEPTVRYLDIALDNPSGAGKKVDQCKPGTFQILTAPWEVGTAVACAAGRNRKRYRIVHVAGDRLLGLGFAGRMRALGRAECVPLPVRPAVAPGATVAVPHVGSMREGVVTRVDASIGRVYVELESGGRTAELAVPFGDVAPTP